MPSFTHPRPEFPPPISYGPLQLTSRFHLSPLAGYTNLSFRRIVRQIGGIGLATTGPLRRLARPVMPKMRRRSSELDFAAGGDGGTVPARRIDGRGRDDSIMALVAIIGRVVAEKWPRSGVRHGCDLFLCSVFCLGENPCSRQSHVKYTYYTCYFGCKDGCSDP